MASTAELKAGTAETTCVHPLGGTDEKCCTAVADSLENSGKLEQLKAKVRAGIYDAIEGPQASAEIA